MTGELTLITTFLYLLAAAIGGSVVALRFRLPPFVGYIAGGILIGSLASGNIDHHLISLISEGGITLLLFTLGIEFSFHTLRKVLDIVAWPAVAQILLTFFFVLLFLTASNVSFIPAVYIAAAISLSSTAIVVQVLTQKGELHTLPGELSAGWLVVQDLAVIPICILLSAVSGNTGLQYSVSGQAGSVAKAVMQAALMLGVILSIGRFGIPKLLSVVASVRNRELLLLTTIGMVFFAGLVMSASGLSVALGAFIAGLMVAETSQNHAVLAEIRPLRNLFVVIFFVSVGMSLPMNTVLPYWHVIIALSVGSFLVKGVLIYSLLRFMRYHQKPAFLVGLYLTQVSEFGFVLAGLGTANGVLKEYHAAMIVAVTFLTIIFSTVAIAHRVRLYAWFSSCIMKNPVWFKKSTCRGDSTKETDGYPICDHVVLCGYGRMGKYIGRALLLADIPFLVIDYNQSVLHMLRQEGIRTVYGDPADKDVLDYAQVDLARTVIIAIPDRHTQEIVIAQALSLNRNVRIICRTHHEEDQAHLKSLGVDTIVQPEFEAALTAVHWVLMQFGTDKEEISGKVQRLKIEHGMG